MLSYDELLKEYERLKKENKILKAKLAVFTDYGGDVISVFPSVDEHTAVNKYSSSQEKIELFKSLFVGRSDVFAKRWYSKTTEKTVISRFVKMNGIMNSATNESINVQTVPTASLCH